MELSFRIKACLDFLVGVLGVLSIAYSYLGIIIGAIGFILLYYEIKDHYRERHDFEGQLADDSVGFLEQILRFSIEAHPSHVVWSSRDDGFKSEMLGETYEVWKKFYDCVERRDRYFGSRTGSDQQVGDINRACFDSFSEVYAKVPWVKEQQQKRIDDLFERKKHIALG